MKDWLGLVKIMEDGGRLSKMCWEGHRSWWMVVDDARWAIKKLEMIVDCLYKLGYSLRW